MVSVDEIRKKYLDFFKKKGHKEISPAPLVLEGDPTTLFTSAGMQPLIPYLKGEKHPLGRRLCDSQPSLRLQDIEEVGDNRHTTFFEMLGNWSLGDYFKEEQLSWCLEFFTKELGIKKEKLWVSVFEGLKDKSGKEIVPRDETSYNIWLKLGIPKERIFFYGPQKNWWSRSGDPELMPEGEIGGPDSEVFYDFGKPQHSGCHPNCDCGRFLEIGNSVFIQYEKKNGKLVELPQKNVDFGGGLERIAMAVSSQNDIFKIGTLKDLVSKIEEVSAFHYGEEEKKDKSFRIVADHLRAAVNILAEGVYPANKLHGYVARRLIRKSVFHLYFLGVEKNNALSFIATSLKGQEKISKNWDFIDENLNFEEAKFKQIMEKGVRKLDKIISEGNKVDGKMAFDLYQNDGFPLELTLEFLGQRGINFDKKAEEVFRSEFEKHKELSRKTAARIFKGGLADHSFEVTKLHTATHLIHSALRKVLGEGVSQKGSNITSERLRFDFSFDRKLTDKEINKVEKMVNEVIKRGLPVFFEEKPLDEAISEGALHFFAERYGKTVKVYTVGDPEGEYFSKEVCGGPHVKNTKEIGRVKIIKQEKLGAGVIRIYAVAES